MLRGDESLTCFFFWSLFVARLGGVSVALWGFFSGGGFRGCSVEIDVLFRVGRVRAKGARVSCQLHILIELPSLYALPLRVALIDHHSPSTDSIFSYQGTRYQATHTMRNRSMPDCSGDRLDKTGDLLKTHIGV